MFGTLLKYRRSPHRHRAKEGCWSIINMSTLRTIEHSRLFMIPTIGTMFNPNIDLHRLPLCPSPTTNPFIFSSMYQTYTFPPEWLESKKPNMSGKTVRNKCQLRAPKFSDKSLVKDLVSELNTLGRDIINETVPNFSDTRTDHHKQFNRRMAMLGQACYTIYSHFPGRFALTQ